MSLESEAKTEEKIWYAYETEVFDKLPDLTKRPRPKIPKELMDRISKKWVPLGDALAQIEAIKENDQVALDTAYHERRQLKEKITEANKIIDEFASKIHEVEFDDMDLIDSTIEKLRLTFGTQKTESEK
jgi:ABC-type phosphate transport system auxiliary subunit